jgi:arginase
MGQERVAPGKGPDAYLNAGIVEKLRHKGYDVKIKTVAAVAGSIESQIIASTKVNIALSEIVGQVVSDGRFPLVLAGNCNSALGTISGVGTFDLGALWFDAHGDFNTPETSISGYFEGMPLAIATGQGHKELWKEMGNSRTLNESACMLIGVRDLDLPEKALLETTAVTVLSAAELRGQVSGVLPDHLARLRSSAAGFYLHLDIDSVDPEDAPGVDYVTPEGLSGSELIEAIEQIRHTLPLKAAALTVYNPERDKGKRTLKLGLRLIEAIASIA